MEQSYIERLVKVESGIDFVSEKVKDIDSKVSNMGCKISEIHGAVVATNVDNKWTKRLVILLVATIIGGSITMGFRAIGDLGNTAQAKQEERK